MFLDGLGQLMPGLLARMSSWWIGRRGLTLLYRGQRQATSRILSPLARVDPSANKALIERMRSVGLSNGEIAGFAAQWHEYPVPPIAAPPGLAGQPLGAVGVTMSRSVGLATHFAAGGVIQLIKLPAASVHRPFGWPCLELEAEYVTLDEVPPDAILRPLAAASVPSLRVNERHQIVLGS